MAKVSFEQKEQDVFRRFNENLDKSIDFVLFKAINGKLEVVALGGPGSTFDDFKSKIMEFGNDGGLLCFRRYMTKGSLTNALVKWIPDSVPVKQRMAWASGWDAFLDYHGSEYLNVLVMTESELDEDAIISQLEKNTLR